MKCALSVLGALAAAASFAAPVVSDVVVSQDAATRWVKVEYSLQDDPAIITVAFRTNGQLVAEKNFTTVVGDVNRLVKPADAHELYWQPERDLVDFATTDFSAEVTAWSLDNPPWYMDIELGKAAGLVKRFYVSSNAVPGGVTDRRYKTTHLLMRRIPAKGLVWCMGGENSTKHLVKLTADYYIGVYEFTLKQHMSIGFSVSSVDFGSSKYPEWETMPMNRASYELLRGSTSESIDWPNTGSTVGNNSVLKKLRDYTGIPTFDLPTEAQWEYAYRAGTSGDYYGGTYSVASMMAGAWIYDNSLNETTGVRAPHPVGLKPANPWGLYDIAGNISEWCRDWYGDYTIVSDDNVETDPKGPESVTSGYRFIKGGNYSQGASLSRAWYRYGYLPSSSFTSTAGAIGFRVVCDAVIPAE